MSSLEKYHSNTEIQFLDLGGKMIWTLRKYLKLQIIYDLTFTEPWQDFSSGSAIKNPPAVQDMQDTQVQSLGWEDPLKRAWQPTPVFLPGGCYGQRSLRATVQGATKSRRRL